jgi:amphi-Trp domain-containing protein
MSKEDKGEKGEKDKVEFQFEKVADVQEVAGYLEALAKNLREGRVSFEAGEERITLTPDGEIFLEIEAERKRQSSKVKLSLAWKTLAPPKPAAPLVITTQSAPD